MKKLSQISIVTIALFYAMSLSAQNYRVLNPFQTTLYQEDSYGYYPDINMYPILVDSVRTTGADTIFYLLKNLQKLGPECFKPYGPSWLGDKILIKPNGETTFYNAFNEPIMIKTRSSLYSNWICYTRADLSFRATISSFTIGNILGIPDSVKTISFQAINADGQNIYHSINDLTMVLSKNHGLSQTLNFYQFPDVPFYILREGVFQLNLVGHDNPPAGIQNLLWHDVHDYSPGDELHVYSNNDNYNMNSNEKRISKVLDKTINGDTTLYTWEHKAQWFNYIHGILENSGTYDIIRTQTVVSNNFFDELPLVAYSLNSGNNFNFFRMTLNTNFELVKEEWNIYGSIYLPSPDDTCFIMNIDIPYSPSVHSYYKGLGGPYHEHYLMGYGGSERTLKYFKKDSVEWGTPYIFPVGTNFYPIDNSNEVLSLFPNPAQNFVNLKFTGNTGEFRLQILDYSGKTISEYTLFGENNVLDLANLKEGVYMLRLMTVNKYITKKLVKL